MVGAGRLASLELSLAGSRHPCYPWPRPCRPAAAAHRPDQKSISHHGQAAAAAAGERAREPPELSIQSHDTFYTQEKFCLTTDCSGLLCLVWVVALPLVPCWPRLAAVPCCSPVFAVPAGAARQPRAALAAGDRRGEVTKNI